MLYYLVAMHCVILEKHSIQQMFVEHVGFIGNNSYKNIYSITP